MAGDFVSSTNRGYNRHVVDYYVTPIPDIINFLKYASQYIDFKNKHILDPCAGGDKFHDMSYPTAFEMCGLTITDTVDIRADSKAQIKCDFFKYHPSMMYDIVISNPPFYQALDFIIHGLNLVKDGGYVIYLLRLNFLGSKMRNKFLRTYVPEYIFVHSNRMSFTDDEKTDSIEYAHFCWKKGSNTQYSKLFVLPL